MEDNNWDNIWKTYRNKYNKETVTGSRNRQLTSILGKVKSLMGVEGKELLLPEELKKLKHLLKLAIDRNERGVVGLEEIITERRNNIINDLTKKIK